MSSEGERYETTVHDKQTGQPVRGCGGDAVAEVERLERTLRMIREHGEDSPSPTARWFGNLARAALSPNEAGR